jgi:hypothetical protein
MGMLASALSHCAVTIVHPLGLLASRRDTTFPLGLERSASMTL